MFFSKHLIAADITIRRLSMVTLLISMGAGIFSSTSFSALVQQGNLTANKFSLSLTAGGILGVIISPLFGFLIDKGDVYGFALWSTLLQAISIVLYLVLDFWPGFIFAVCIFSVASQIASISRGTLVAISVPKDSRSQSRGYTYTMANIGISIGALLGTILISCIDQYGSRIGVILDSFLIFFAFIALTRLKCHKEINHFRTTYKNEPRFGSLKDQLSGRKVALLLFICLLVTSGSLVTVGFANWLYKNGISLSLIGLWTLLSTIFIASIHVPVSKYSEGKGASRSAFLSGILLLSGLSAFGLVIMISPSHATCLIVATFSVLLIAAAGSFSAASGWSMSYSLAHDSSVSFNQGLFNAVFGLGSACAAPIAVWASSKGEHWIILGGIYFASGIFTALLFSNLSKAVKF